MKTEFVATTSPKVELLAQATKLAELSFSDKRIVNDVLLYFKTPSSSEIYLFCLIKNSKVIAMACGMKTTIRFSLQQEKVIFGISLGAVCVDLKERNRGMGRELLDNISYFSKQESIDVIYLQGIPGFYEKLNFENILNQSKIVVDLRKFETNEKVSIRDFESSNLRELVEIHDEMAEAYLFAGPRSYERWKFLTTDGKLSRLFYNPFIVEVDGIKAYFTTDPIERGRVREYAHLNYSKSAEALLAGLKYYQLSNNLLNVEIMAHRDSKIFSLISKSTNMTFIEHARVGEGLLGKLVDELQFFENVMNRKIIKVLLSEHFLTQVEFKIEGNKFYVFTEEENVDIGFIPLERFLGTIFGRFNLEGLSSSIVPQQTVSISKTAPAFCMQGDSL